MYTLRGSLGTSAGRLPGTLLHALQAFSLDSSKERA